MSRRVCASMLAMGIFTGMLTACAPINHLKPDITMRDIYDAVDHKLDAVPSPILIDEDVLINVFQISPNDVEEYYGKLSSQGPDTFLCVKVKRGRVKAVQKCLKSRLKGLNKQYEADKTSADYEKVLSGRVFTRDRCYFLLVSGKVKNPAMKDTHFDAEADEAQETVYTFFE